MSGMLFRTSPIKYLKINIKQQQQNMLIEK